MVTVAPGNPVLATNASLAGNWREGDTAQFSCTTTGGNPTPNVTWYRNDVILPDSAMAPPSVKYGTTSGTVVRQLTADDDAANYSCVARNSYATASSMLRLRVQCTCCIRLRNVLSL